MKRERRKLAVVTVGKRITFAEEHWWTQSTGLLLNRCGFNIEYARTDNHEQVVAEYLKQHIDQRTQYNWLLFVDVDFFVLDPARFKEVLLDIYFNRYALAGILQNANHLPGTPDYIAPAFAHFNLEWWREYADERPEVKTIDADVLGLYTDYCQLYDGPIRAYPPAHSLIPRWRLADGTIYGIGSYYPELGAVHVYCARDEKFSKELSVWLGRIAADIYKRRIENATRTERDDAGQG